MAVTLSKSEQIVAALQTALAGIIADGTNYNRTPARVPRVRWWKRDWLDAGRGSVLIFMRPGQETHTEYATQLCRAFMEIFLLVCSKNERPSDDPFEESESGSESGWQVENKAVRDVLKKLWSDVTLGGLANNIVDGSLIVDRAQFVDGWDVTEMRMVIDYQYEMSAP